MRRHEGSRVIERRIELKIGIKILTRNETNVRSTQQIVLKTTFKDTNDLQTPHSTVTLLAQFEGTVLSTAAQRNNKRSSKLTEFMDFLISVFLYLTHHVSGTGQILPKTKCYCIIIVYILIRPKELSGSNYYYAVTFPLEEVNLKAGTASVPKT